MLWVRAAHCSLVWGLSPSALAGVEVSRNSRGFPSASQSETGVRLRVPFTTPRRGELLCQALKGCFGGRGVLPVDAGNA